MRNGNIIIKLNSILQQWFEAFRTILLWRSNLSFYGFSRNVQWCFSVSLVSAHESTDILITICVPEFPQSAFQQPLRKQLRDILFQGQTLLWSLYLGLNKVSIVLFIQKSEVRSERLRSKQLTFPPFFARDMSLYSSLIKWKYQTPSPTLLISVYLSVFLDHSDSQWLIQVS